MDNTLSLSGLWSLRPADLGKAEKYTDYFRDGKTLEVDTQNSIYTELVVNGVINEKIRFISDLEWILTRTFNCERRCDRYCLKMRDARDIHINGTPIDSFDITDCLQDGENTIQITVSSSFRGDSIELCSSCSGVIYSAHLKPMQVDDHWHIKVEIDYESFREQTLKARIELEGHVIEEELSFGKGRERKCTYLDIPAEDVELWNVIAEGKQRTYIAYLTLGDTTLERTVAFRNIEVSPDGIIANGKPIFYRGALWPVSINPDRRRYEELLSAVANGYMNCLLIEKGHETHTFYRIADRMGIIVLHEKDNPAYSFHPSYVSGDFQAEVFEAGSGHFTSYYEEICSAALLERWVLKTRCDESVGVLYDNLLSTVTQDGAWWAGHFAARRFFAGLVPVMYRDGDKVEVFISNDTENEEEVDLSVKFLGFNGTKKKKHIYETVVPPETSKKVASIDISRIDTANEFAYIKMRTRSLHREFTLLLKDDFRLCNLEDPRIEFKVREINPRSFEIHLKSIKPAFGILLQAEGIEGTFSDGFFEIRPSSDKSVIFTPHRDITLRELEDSLRIESLFTARLEQL